MLHELNTCGKKPFWTPGQERSYCKAREGEQVFEGTHTHTHLHSFNKTCIIRLKDYFKHWKYINESYRGINKSFDLRFAACVSPSNSSCSQGYWFQTRTLNAQKLVATLPPSFDPALFLNPHPRQAPGCSKHNPCSSSCDAASRCLSHPIFLSTSVRKRNSSHYFHYFCHVGRKCKCFPFEFGVSCSGETVCLLKSKQWYYIVEVLWYNSKCPALLQLCGIQNILEVSKVEVN